ncbi:ABC transporter permease [Mycoplasmatota bacterium WC44]
MENKMKGIMNFFRKPLVKYVFKRIFSSMITLFFIITATFLMLRMMPKDKYIDKQILQKIPAESRESYKWNTWEKLGLNDPLWKQLGTYYYNVLPFPKDVCVQDRYVENYTKIECVKYEKVTVNFGTSLVVRKGKPVTEFIAEKFPISFLISILALTISYIIGYPLGVLMAKGKGGVLDWAGNGYIIMTFAVPGLVFYYLWFIIAMKMNLPSFFAVDNPLTWITPVWSIAFLSIGGRAMWMRRFMVSELNTDYVKFARSKGLSENRIMFTHVFRNAFVPLVRNVPAALIFAMVGSYFVETLFTIPGSGRLLITSLQKIDNPLVQGLVIVYSGMSMAAFLLGDLITVFFDPRISLTHNK